MSRAYGPRFCCRCQKPITGVAVAVPGFSASGARADAHRHPDDYPDCWPRRKSGAGSS